MVNVDRIALRWCLVLAVVAVVGCRSEPDAEDAPKPQEQSVEEPETDDLSEEVARLYGVPLPPDYFGIRHEPYRVRVSTDMSLEEVAEFFEREAVDYEVFVLDRRVEVVPLRSQAGHATARWYGGRHGHVVINYRRRAEPSEVYFPPLPKVDEAPSAEEDRRIARRSEVPLTEPKLPHWVEERKGQPVELRDENGELIAPGARWGEPYIPPEGSHLANERYRHLWGRPYGAW